MKIKDRDVKHALETLIDEIGNYESVIDDNEVEEEAQILRIEQLEEKIGQLESTIVKLEETIAELYLTSEANDGVQREAYLIPAGCRPNVPNPTGDKAE